MRFSEEEIADTVIKSIYGLTHKKISSGTEELVESGILNSITITELAVEIEKSFSVTVSFMDITRENFRDVNSIKELIKRKLH